MKTPLLKLSVSRLGARLNVASVIPFSLIAPPKNEILHVVLVYKREHRCRGRIGRRFASVPRLIASRQVQRSGEQANPDDVTQLLP